jgi:dephospho-CoA kinase/predicted RNA-binding Zn-ribbon protein involved in translation (DUF1610 family)
MKTWYDYLTLEFRLDKKAYRVNDRYSFDCPKCGKSGVHRLNHIKRKIKDLGYYECSKCRKQAGVSRARDTFKDKYGDKNPFQLESVKKRIKETNLEKYGVDCILKLPEVHKKGIKAAASETSRAKAKETQFDNHGSFNLQRPEIQELIQKTIKTKALKTRQKWKNENGKVCGHCKVFKSLDQYTSIKFPSSKCKVCTNLYHNEYSIIRKSLLGYSTTGESLLGCTIEEFSDYIEFQFKEGMSWENWSLKGWHLDHIIPLKFINEENKHIIHNYKNFRPLWSTENQSKNDKTPQVIILTGTFGSGKSTISNKLSDEYFILNKDLKHDIYDIGKSSLNKTVIYQTSFNVVKDINLISQFFEVKDIVVIQEPINVVQTRLLGRGGKFNESNVKSRIKRMESIAKKYGTFSGTADKCLEYLKNLS